MKKIYLLMMYFVAPISLYANESKITVNEVDSHNVEKYVKEILNPVIYDVLSNHEEPVGCSYGAGANPCSGYSSYYKKQNINTPLDVYCAEKVECCDNAIKQKNREQYCECKAKNLREKFYDLKDVNNKSLFEIQFLTHFASDDSCDKYSDSFIESDQVYDRFFYTCKWKNDDVKFCDKLAQTIHDVIKTELIMHASNKAKKTNNDIYVAVVAYSSNFKLYESEYAKIINSKEFLSLFEQ